MDLKQDKRSDFEQTKKSSNSNLSSQIKSCSVCQTTRTPLWRGGPAGPKSLCNACGIKYNKKRREMLGLDRGKNDNKAKKKRKNHHQSSSELSQSMKKMRLMALGHDMLLLHRSDKLMSKLREEERAAILLMALSCGSAVYA